MSREDTIEDLKSVMRQLEARKREIDMQYNAVAMTVQILDSGIVSASTPSAEPEDGDENESAVPW